MTYDCIILGAGVLILLPGLRVGFNLFYVIAAIVAAVARLR